MNLNSWLSHEGLFKASDAQKQPSHLLLNGGTIYVPKNKEKMFNKYYANDLRNNVKLFYVEVRPEIFKFMIDLDISDDNYWSDEKILKISIIINTIVNEFYKNSTLICCKASAKIKKNNQESEKIHTGVHLIYPQIFISADNAMIIRDAILQSFNDKYMNDLADITQTTKTWSSIIDERIYIKNGFRMIGSDKIIDKKKGTYENRVYWPFAVLNSKQELVPEYLNILLNDIERMMYDTSIRIVPENIMDMKPHIPSWTIIDLKKIKNVSNSNSHGSYTSGTQEHIIIENFIRNNIIEYKNITNLVSEVAITENDNILVKTGTKYCMNLGREHNSCGIYFFIHKNGYLIQKCLCPCDNLTDRKNGLCKDYQSKQYIVPNDLLFILFGHQNSNVIFRSLDQNNKDQNNKDQNNKDQIDKTVEKVLKKDLKTETSNVSKNFKNLKISLPYTSKKSIIKRQEESCGNLISKILELDGFKKIENKKLKETKIKTKTYKKK